MLAYGSRRLSATEQNYCINRRELLAAVEFTSHFRHYLLGRKFAICTDHSSLRWLTRLREPEGQLTRWLEKLAEYDFQVIYPPGKYLQNADAQSRRPCQKSCPCTVPMPELATQIQHKVMQCDLTNDPLAAGILKHPPVGVVESYDDNLSPSQPKICRVSEPTLADLFGGWTQEQLCATQGNDPDVL